MIGGMDGRRVAGAARQPVAGVRMEGYSVVSLWSAVVGSGWAGV